MLKTEDLKELQYYNKSLKMITVARLKTNVFQFCQV